MQAIKCSKCRTLVFWYDGDIRVGKIDASKATYPDGSKVPAGRTLSRTCGHGRIFGRQDCSLYIDGDTEIPAIPEPKLTTVCPTHPHTLDPSCIHCEDAFQANLHEALS